MALSNEQIEVCNIALSYLGEYRITASRTTEKQYVACDLHYIDAVKETLVEHNWNEAKTRCYLVEYSVAPVFGYTYKFALPDDFLALVRIGDGANDWNHWEIEGDYLLTNEAQSPLTYTVGEKYTAGQYLTYSDVTYYIERGFTATAWATDVGYLGTTGGDYSVLKLEYIKYLTKPSSWSPNLKDCIAQRLAVKVATSLTNDSKLKTDIQSEFENLSIRKARSIDARQGKVRPFFKSHWWNTRQSNYS